jgi:YD repeat-containing protein
MAFSAFALMLSTASAQQTTTYSYDELGRLTDVNRSDNVDTQFSYDPAGNRTSQVVTGSSNAAPVSGVVVLPIAGFIVIPLQ